MIFGTRPARDVHHASSFAARLRMNVTPFLEILHRWRHLLMIIFVIGIVMYTLALFGRVPPINSWSAALMLPLISVYLLTCNTLVCWEILKTFNAWFWLGSLAVGLVALMVLLDDGRAAPTATSVLWALASTVFVDSSPPDLRRPMALFLHGITCLFCLTVVLGLRLALIEVTDREFRATQGAPALVASSVCANALLNVFITSFIIVVSTYLHENQLATLTSPVRSAIVPRDVVETAKSAGARILADDAAVQGPRVVFCTSLSPTDLNTAFTFALGWGCGTFVFNTMKSSGFVILNTTVGWGSFILLPLELTGLIPVYSSVGIVVSYSGFLTFVFTLCNPTLVKKVASMVDMWRLLGAVIIAYSLLAALLRDGRALAVMLFMPGCMLTPFTDALPAIMRPKISIGAYFGGSLFCYFVAGGLLFGAIPVHDFDLVNAGNLRITALSTCFNMFVNCASFYVRFGVKAVQHPEDFVIFNSPVECISMTESAYRERLLVDEALMQTASIAASTRQASKKANRTAKVSPAPPAAPLPVAAGSADAILPVPITSMDVAVASAVTEASDNPV